MGAFKKVSLMGLDIGQGQTPSAICVAEAELRITGDQRIVHFDIRYLERLPLGTPYPEIARRLAELSENIETKTRQAPRIYADLTGLGDPILTILRDAGPWVEPVYFNHGDQRSKGVDSWVGKIILGKAYLVSRLQALLQTRRIHLPGTQEAKTLAEELLAYQVDIDPDANNRYGAFHVGSHDDLVTALGLAVQEDPIFHSGFNLELPEELQRPGAHFFEDLKRIWD